ncbi:AB-hydrolase YheT [Mycena filopes]|nr:AB-hydrolase YheT [Mycena filopes]
MEKEKLVELGATVKRRKRPGRTPAVHFPPKTANVHLKSGETVSLQELVESRCTSLYSKYKPAWWLFNGHLQTAYSLLGDFSQVDRVWYQRRLLRLLDGGTLGLDFVPSNASLAPDDTPIIVVQHGLTGGSHEPYVRAILAPACTPVEKGGLGYRAVVVNFRGCSGVPITSPKFYTAAQTDDLRQALMFISHLYPHAPLLGLGFSIGGNVLIRYLAEEGEDSRLSSACILGCPWDIKTNNDHLLNSTLGRHVYLRGMGANVTSLIRHHRLAFLSDPTHPASRAVPHILHLKSPTLTDFDALFTCVVSSTPPFPFPDVHAYYAWASCSRVAGGVRVPTLTINARDDPVVRGVQRAEAEGEGGSACVVGVVTRGGGHLGWFEGGRRRWTTGPVLEWFRVFGREVVLASPLNNRDSNVVEEEDGGGYLRDARWPALGCKEVEGGGLIDGNRPSKELFQGL